jgi:aconitate hydratase
VLSGNRNFEARIHQSIKSNFLASPMLVVAYGLAGHIDIDLTYEPVGLDPNGRPVYLDDIWPSNEQIEALIAKHVKKEFYEVEYGRIFDGDEFWRNLPEVKSVTYEWDEKSTYIKNPPYFEGFKVETDPVQDVSQARVLVWGGDTVTTDHISPAGAIPENYPAGKYLIAQGVQPAQFNSYGSRRGNHEVMMRGTFGNIRLKNLLVEGKEGSWTVKYPEGDERFIYDAAMAYQQEQTPVVVLAGREYGTGSSRDWAAKGSNLLGVRAVIAESFERIHRSNLVGMGVLPLVYAPGDNARKLGLDGSEHLTIKGLDSIQPRQQLTVTAEKPDGDQITFQVTARLDTEVDVAYFKNGGILPYVLRKIIS